ncbi:MAG: tryptophan synthase subunit alpha, partial [Gammaproteobacteria bacterium]
GDPTRDFTVPLMHQMVASGANMIELGVPFSDPMADGPTIQRASERALENNISLRDVLSMVHEFRQKDAATPVILMGYLNPIEVMGYQEFADAAADAGVDGVLTVDLPPEEAEGLLDALCPKQIDPILLLAPTSTTDRIKRISDVASGFIYYVSMRGTTGGGSLLLDEVRSKVAEIRQQSALPIGIGFGIRDAESARTLSRVGDAVVVGSVLVDIIERMAATPDQIAPEITRILRSMRAAMDLA